MINVNLKTERDCIMKRFVALLLFMAFFRLVDAQDFSLVNHNLTPFSLNPSLAGNANALRWGVNYRQQWMALGNNYHTFRASYDQNFYKRMSSLGVAYAYDNMASGVYNTNEISLVYAHTIKLRDFYFIRLGLQASMFINQLGWDKVKYGDQYDPNTRKPTLETLEQFDNDSRTFFDFSAGASFIIENKLTVGGAVYHLAEPSNGFVELEENVLKRKFVGHINFIQDLQYSNGLFGRNDLSDNYLFVNASYQQQDKFKMVNAGVGATWDPLIVGVSDKNNLDGINVIAFMVGGHYKGLQVFYVYDLFTSSKKNGSWSHEINFIYIYQKHEKYPCPVVYW